MNMDAKGKCAYRGPSSTFLFVKKFLQFEALFIAFVLLPTFIIWFHEGIHN